MKILVVDDYATMRRIVRNLLSQIGHLDVEEAGDGIVALQKLRETQFGLVISDWNMEPMTGLQRLWCRNQGVVGFRPFPQRSGDPA